MDESFEKECVSKLTALGFSQEQALIALRKFQYDVDLAAEFLFNGETNDNEFDLLEEQEAFPPPPSVFNNLDHATSDSQQVEVEDFLEFDDSRIASLKEMGFSAEDAMNALRICDGDVNEALNYLLTSKD